jgi:hypothetical protein
LTADPTREEMEDLKRLAAEGDVDSFGDPAMSIAAAEAAADDEGNPSGSCRCRCSCSR